MPSHSTEMNAELKVSWVPSPDIQPHSSPILYRISSLYSCKPLPSIPPIGTSCIFKPAIPSASLKMSRQSFMVPDKDPRWATHSPVAPQWFIPPDLNALPTYDILLIETMPCDGEFINPIIFFTPQRIQAAKCEMLHTDSLTRQSEN
ncbi:uncharacterized protein LW94_7136 [Fusarium fujikuroi]|nr:uncharacterized protein LW94_7136 [Fusarium fujikuroi]SCO53000.1 uncharacterized protein FFMR_11319 [Fusarium fujikuroi]